MILPEVQDGSGQLRQRRMAAKSDNIVGEVGAYVQEFDAFVKVMDDVREEPRIAKGILSVVCFALISVLVVGQLHDYWTNTDVEYKFSVDTDYDDKPTLDLDMIVATPCNNLAIMPMGVDRLRAEEPDRTREERENDEGLKKNPSRFDMNSEETQLWQTLQKVHRDNFKPGTQLKSVNEMTFMRHDVEKGLRRTADAKQALEMQEVEKQKEEARAKGDSTGSRGIEDRFVLMIGNGLGVFQIISARVGGGSEVDEGSACRISGKVPVNKGNGDRLSITIGKSLGISNIIAHVGGGGTKGNVSHRIERFHFGPHIWGLVTPLAGNEQITEKSGTEYKYFIKVVPTKIYPSSAELFRKPKMTYQYSVTYTKKEGDEGQHVHDSIVFDYDFTATMIEVRPVQMSIVQLLLRLCAIIGGVFATSCLLDAFVSYLNRLGQCCVDSLCGKGAAACEQPRLNGVGNGAGIGNGSSESKRPLLAGD